MTELFPPIEPYDRGWLNVGDGNRVYWETCGSPEGKPAVVVHGGPGTGCAPNMRRCFDPSIYRIVLFDQRGCGQSTPHASDLTTDMRFNTTHHLIADMERLRAHLGIERWLLSAGSWGCTLSLAYAERYPQRVVAMVLSAVTTGERSENAWLYHDVAQFFPEAFERFRADAKAANVDEDLPTAYAKLMESHDQLVRKRAAESWCAWEDTVLSLESQAKPNLFSECNDRDMQAFVRVCTHYVSHGAWLDEGVLLREANRLAGIPGVIIHGRRDLSCPVGIAWQLSRVWRDAELVVLDDSGHQGSPSKRRYLLAAHARFANESW